MTNIQLLSVCCRAFGIYLVFSTLPLFLTFLDSLNALTGYGSAGDPYGYFSWTIYLVTPVIWLVLAAILFFAPRQFARTLLSEDIGEDRKSDWTAEELQAVAFSTVGLYLLASALVNAQDWFAIVRTLENGMEYAVGNKSIYPPPSVFIIEHILKIFVGAWLLFGAGGLSNLVSRWRKARFRPPASDAARKPDLQTCSPPAGRSE